MKFWKQFVVRKKGFVGHAHEMIRLKDLNFKYIPPYMANDQRYMPYFKVINYVYLLCDVNLDNLLLSCDSSQLSYNLYLHVWIVLDTLMVHI